jgi:primosomal protein N' (replication factor Y) (superfamily II helicase)
MSPIAVVEVAVFAPLRQTFHYLGCVAPNAHPALPGSLVKIPFGRGQRTGIVIALVNSTDERPLKPISEVVDTVPVIGTGIMRLARWAADYYQHPIGEVLAATLPGALRQGSAPARREESEWVISESKQGELNDLARRAPRQALLLERLSGGAKMAADFADLDFDWRRAMRELEKKDLVAKRPRTANKITGSSHQVFSLNDAQRAAVIVLNDALGSFKACLLHGVTGSGKTEVYMAAIEQALKSQLNTLMLVPEIILTHQMVARLTQRFGSAVGVLHSGLNDNQRAQVWLRCRAGDINILMGTRSAVWAPLPRIGIIIVDEEHDISFKQQDGFRYSARDVAIKRAQQLNVPIVLGSATPSLEAYFNVKTNKFAYLSLPQRAGVARMPSLKCVDVRGLRLRGGLSDQLVRDMGGCLERGEQVLLFLNRRGFAPIVLCHQCGHIATCSRCDAKLVWHKERKLLSCHHCGAQKRTQHLEACCREPEIVPLGLGTEQVEETLRELFPSKNIARIDRDTMRGKNAMEETFAAIRGRAVDILIGTQMLAKGHDFANVTLVGIIDADSQLFSTDFRAEEKLAQTIIQVSGRAGRAEYSGSVLIQTHHPHHDLLQTLLLRGYDHFAEKALDERRRAALPPYVAMALIRAESPSMQMPMKFLTQLAAQVKQKSIKGLEILGPIPAAMERRAGRYRAQLMVSAQTRRVLATGVKAFINLGGEMPLKNKVRWSVDIDPLDTI